MATQSKSVALPHGVSLSYVEQGNASGVPVVLLHGITDSWRSFEPVLPHLPASIRAFAVSQRGHGTSDRPEGYRCRDFARDVLAFLNAFGLERAVIVGHSMGGTNAQRFALDHPERTAGLVLVASFAGFRANAAVVDFWESAVAPLADPIDPSFALEFQRSTLAQPVPPAFLDMVVRESLLVPARVWREAFAGLLEDDCVAELDHIDVPTLLVWGARDALTPRSDQETLRVAIAGSRLVVYENAGHALHWEEPRRFAADLVAFVDGLPTAG